MIREKFRALYEKLKPTFDGCTNAPDFDFGETCCAEHDFHYCQHDIPRAQADRLLRECISEGGKPVIGVIYWLAVRTFGGFFWRRKRGLKSVRN